MRTVTAGFLSAQKKPDARVIRTIQYKRRYWIASSRSYGWEADWTDLSPKSVSSVSAINGQLDTDILNEFKVSNVSLVLDNDFGRFNFENEDGFFGKDSGSPIVFYEPYWTKFRIRTGFELADGTDEVITMFTGLATEYVYDSEQKTVQVTLQGLEAVLQNSKAEGIATSVTSENVGVGNGVTTEFTTANPGVGGVTLVSDNYGTLVEGDDYTISQLNESTLGAKITFTTAPTVAHVIRATYFYWPQNLQFSDVVELLLVAAGFSTSALDIEPTIFSNSIISTFNYDSSAEFLTGTLTDLLATEHTSDLEIDWTASNNKDHKNWTNSTSGWTITNTAGLDATLTSDGTKFTFDSGGLSPGQSWAVRALDRGIGTWTFNLALTSVNKPSVLFKMGNTLVPGGFTTAHGFTVKFLHDGITITDNGAATTAIGAYTFDALEHAIQITFNGSTIFVYVDSVLKVSLAATLQNYKLEYIAFDFDTDTRGSVSASHQTATVRDIYTPAASGTGNWISPVIDALASPTAWGVFEKEEDDGGAAGCITYYTSTSPNNITYEAYAEITGSGGIGSTLNRYIKIKIAFSYPTNTWPRSASGQNDPFVNFVQLQLTTDSVAVLLPAFTGASVYDAVQKIGEYTNYEFGFTADERFFFRPKTAGSSVMNLTQSDYNSKITGMSSGYERAYGAVRAIYGSISREVTDTGDYTTSLKARVGDRRFEITPDSSIQVSPAADVATGIAKGLFAYFSKRRRRFKLTTKFLPQIELSDVVTISLINETPPRLWLLGDNSVNHGDSDVFQWGEKNQLTFNTQAKVIGARYDPERFACEFDLEEVVS